MHRVVWPVVHQVHQRAFVQLTFKHVAACCWAFSQTLQLNKPFRPPPAQEAALDALM